MQPTQVQRGSPVGDSAASEGVIGLGPSHPPVAPQDAPPQVRTETRHDPQGAPNRSFRTSLKESVAGPGRTDPLQPQVLYELHLQPMGRELELRVLHQLGSALTLTKMRCGLSAVARVTGLPQPDEPRSNPNMTFTTIR